MESAIQPLSEGGMHGPHWEASMLSRQVPEPAPIIIPLAVLSTEVTKLCTCSSFKVSFFFIIWIAVLLNRYRIYIIKILLSIEK